MALVPGEIIDGKYRIVRPIGEGGMGMVYEGENTRIKRRVAIKILHEAVSAKADVVQRFEREAQAAGRIGSEHIVEVLDLGNLPSGERYMVMEYLDGEDLTHRIKRNVQLTAAQCAPLAIQILEGLAAAHDAGIVHRDLKPDNIYILAKSAGRTDFVKILDFGVSKFSSLDTEMSMTRTGAVVGTPYYMSPEQAKGDKVDPRSDLYSIGVVLYQMASGRVPFTAGSFNELLFKIVLESPAPLTEIVPTIDPAFADIVAKAMHRDPLERFQDAREFQLALAAFAHATGAGVQAPAASYAAYGGPSAAASGAYSAAAAASAAAGHVTPSSTNALQNVPFAMGSPRIMTDGASTPGTLGMSQAALSMTHPPSTGAGKKLALAIVVVATVAVGGLGGFLLAQPDGVAASREGVPSGAASGPTLAASSTTTASGSGVAASATASAEVRPAEPLTVPVAPEIPSPPSSASATVAPIARPIGGYPDRSRERPIPTATPTVTPTAKPTATVARGRVGAIKDDL
ncbi:MAG: serine/threonine protein kinase [Myxococcales bacterium]|nr:serine/threonine protein kinase [Myxococcales bacterium]